MTLFAATLRDNGSTAHLLHEDSTVSVEAVSLGGPNKLEEHTARAGRVCERRERMLRARLFDLRNCCNAPVCFFFMILRYF